MISTRMSWLLFMAVAACGKVQGDDGGDDGGIDAPPGNPITPPAIAVTQHPIAGTPIKCTITTPATGGSGTLSYRAAWSLDSAAFTTTMTSMFMDDTVPGAQTHTGHTFACVVTASDGTQMVASTPATTMVDPRFAYLIDQPSNSLNKIDLDTQDVTVVGTLGVTFSFGDLGWDVKTQTMYMVDGNSSMSLYKVNLATGAATLVGANNQFVRALGYDPGGDRMFGGTGGGPLLGVNLTNGAMAAIGAAALNLDSLAFDTVRGRMIGITANVGGGTINAINLVNGTAQSLGGAGPIDNHGLTYDPVVDRFFAATFPGEILMYDPVTFTRTNLKSIPGKRFTSIAVAIPLPPP